MAHRRSPPTRAHTLPISPSPTTGTLVRRRKYTLRRSPNSRRRALGLLHPSRSNSHASTRIESEKSDDEDDRDTGLRPVLAALHQNLRRLPSRLLLTATRHKRDRDSSMRDISHERDNVQIGTKRKRVASSNENTASGPSTRGSRMKRIKATRHQDSEDDDEASGMEVDTPTTWAASDNSDEDEDAMNSSDDHLLNTAPSRQLLRLRKDELIRLYTSAGLTPPSSFESLTKPEIVDAIISAREDDDDVELPPSSPRGESEYSSEGEADDGNVAGGEETDVGTRAGRTRNIANPLRRRATVNDLMRGAGKPIKGRSLSMGQLSIGENLKSGRLGKGVVDGRRRNTHGSSSRSSPTTSMSRYTHLPSPPATRTRSRKISSDTSITSNSVNAHSKTNGRVKNRSKQVEFSDDVEVQVASPFPIDDDEAEEYDSELTDLTELEADIHRTPRASSSKGVNGIAKPSPRRLRSNGKETRRVAVGVGRSGAGEHDTEAAEVGRRITPMRKAKGKIGSLREDSESVEEDGEDSEGDGGGTDEDTDDEEGAQVDEEVDELASSPSPTPPPVRGRRTPVKRRLRPRRVQTYTPPSDGDDEEEEEVQVQVDDVEESVDESETDVFEDAEEGPASTTPRKLRSGRIVGEEDISEENEDDEEEEEAFVDADGESIDIDETEEDTDEPMEDDIDLTIATTKTLVRLRRDDLVRLCETRDLDAVGTKPQLASALLEWRDRQSQSGFSSPSSTGTIRAPDTIKRRRKFSSGEAKSYTRSKTPVLLRSHHFHADEPRTPPISDSSKDQEPELELDLESLGLEDREIPPEKLTKHEKIGSGGFKDVFIGKLKGRKVAISEFRGQLSAMDIKELKLLGGFDHPNIVRFLGVSIPENTRETPVMIVSELCANGDLFDYVRNVQPPSLHKVLNMMLDIARGLEYLHLRKPSVIHRDCKSSNILITSRGTAKIADFGLAKVKQSTRSMVRSLVGTVNWQAPELWHAHPKYNHKVDVFSCAMVYWEMLQWHVTNKKFPWEGMNEHAIYEIVGAKQQRPSVSGLRKVWCPEIVDLIERMWAQDHQDRPTMSEVVEELEHMVHS